MAKKATLLNNGPFGSGLTSSQWSELTKAATSSPVVALLLSEYEGIYNRVIIDGLRSLYLRLEFLKTTLDQAEKILPEFVNQSPRKKTTRKSNQDQEILQGEDYDDKAWDRYAKILALYTKLLKDVEDIKRTLVKSDQETVDSEMSLITQMHK